MKIGIYTRNDGKLATSYEAAAPDYAKYGGPWGDKSTVVHVEIPSTMDARATTWDKVNSVVVEDTTLKGQLAQQDAVNTVNTLVQNAMDFGQSMVKEFAVQNVILGITADGKTGQVLDVMNDASTALQSGSLYEAITRIKAIPSASRDSKYVTAARMLAFVNKIETYLGVTLSTSL